jgi:hypothetical protein
MSTNSEDVAFVTDRQYMRKFNDYTVAAGGGSITHGLGYVPYFLPAAIESGYLIPIRTGNIYFPSGDIPFYIVEATTTQITITEDIAPLNAPTYTIRVYENPLP